MKRRTRRKKNPISGNLVMLSGLAIAAYMAWQWWQKNQPQSAAEKEVNNLYGPTQGWRTSPVYNTPGTSTYIPTLPVSYPPGTPSSAMTLPPGTREQVSYTPTIADRLKSVFGL